MKSPPSVSWIVQVADPRVLTPENGLGFLPFMGVGSLVKG